ncbi:Universal stress protein [Streptomyces sp. RB5]|uniref:Universal stress protein n=1 Tax=Streptomyces smaragdinus TaxID=2585196 RepID=A0A7K0CM31_9ACTN|nr:universal stress protein [Streptomyces smaragdinus]MQY14537.1 Universal stress protein [Streptomyces smaragdinus]
MRTRAVVAGIDGSARSLAAADWAAREAAARELPLRVVHAGPAVTGDHFLEHAVELLGNRHGGLRITGERAASLTADAELLVVATRGVGGFPGLLLGSTAWEAAARAPFPVALVPSGRDVAAVGDIYGRRFTAGEIVVGVDARAAVDETLAYAFDAADRSGTTLRALHAWRMPLSEAARLPFRVPEDRGAREDHETHLLHEALRPWREKYPHVTVRPDVRALTPARALVAASARAGRLIVGRRGPGLSAVTDAVLHHARSPVVVVPR